LEVFDFIRAEVADWMSDEVGKELADIVSEVRWAIPPV
jgi:hypothetical protein